MKHSACRIDRYSGENGGARNIDEEKTAGKLPAAFQAEQILITRFVKQAAASVNQRFGDGCE